MKLTAKELQKLLPTLDTELLVYFFDEETKEYLEVDSEYPNEDFYPCGIWVYQGTDSLMIEIALCNGDLRAYGTISNTGEESTFDFLFYKPLTKEDLMEGN